MIDLFISLPDNCPRCRRRVIIFNGLCYFILGLIVALYGLSDRYTGILFYPASLLLIPFVNEMDHSSVIYIIPINIALFTFLGVMIALLLKERRKRTIADGIIIALILISPKAAMFQSMQESKSFIAKMKNGYEKILQSDPDRADAHFWLGTHYFVRTNDTERATRHFERHLEIEKTTPIEPTEEQHALICLASLYEKQKAYEKSDLCFARFMETHPILNGPGALPVYYQQYLTLKQLRKEKTAATDK